MIGVQLAEKFVLICLSIHGLHSWVCFALCNSNSWSQIVHQCCVIWHSNWTKYDLVVLSKGHYWTEVVYGSCLIVHRLFGDLANKLVAHVVVDLVVFLHRVFFWKYDGHAQVFRREQDLVTKLDLLSEQILHVLLSTLHLRWEISLIDVKDRFVWVALERLTVCLTAVQSCISNHIFAVYHHVYAKVCGRITPNKFNLANLVSLRNKLETFYMASI